MLIFNTQISLSFFLNLFQGVFMRLFIVSCMLFAGFVSATFAQNYLPTISETFFVKDTGNYSDVGPIGHIAKSGYIDVVFYGKESPMDQKQSMSPKQTAMLAQISATLSNAGFKKVDNRPDCIHVAKIHIGYVKGNSEEACIMWSAVGPDRKVYTCTFPVMRIGGKEICENLSKAPKVLGEIVHEGL
jgi:hypothetical protein